MVRTRPVAAQNSVDRDAWSIYRCAELRGIELPRCVIGSGGKVVHRSGGKQVKWSNQYDAPHKPLHPHGDDGAEQGKRKVGEDGGQDD